MPRKCIQLILSQNGALHHFDNVILEALVMQFFAQINIPYQLKIKKNQKSSSLNKL